MALGRHLRLGDAHHVTPQVDADAEPQPAARRLINHGARRAGRPGQRLGPLHPGGGRGHIKLFGHIEVKLSDPNPPEGVEDEVKAKWTYAWTQTGGTPGTLTKNTEAKANFVAAERAEGQENYDALFEVVINDGSTTRTEKVKQSIDVEGPPDARKTWILLLATIACIALLVFKGAKRGKQLGLDIDGREPLND